LVFVVLYLKKFPAKEDFDASLVAFFKSNLVCVREREDLFVGGPVLNLGVI
jgi:hypothetical protein